MAEPAAGTGSYSIARRPGEVERLALQSAVLAAETEHLLDRIGVGAGWDCLDLGCGPGGITRPLSARVGPTGTVTGLDFDPAFVAIAAEGAAANTRFLQGNAYDTGLPGRCVVESVSEEFLLFSPSGVPLRARLSVTFREYVTPEEQATVTPKYSPDHDKLVTVRRGQTLPQIAFQIYGDPREWRPIADANGLDDPLALTPGQRLLVPKGGARR